MWPWRCAGWAPRRLAAANARKPEGRDCATRRQAREAPDGLETEAARLRAEHANGGQPCRPVARAVVDRTVALQAEVRPAGRAATRAEVDGWVGDEAGHQTHSHARHCTPGHRPRKAGDASPIPAVEQLRVERLHLREPDRRVESAGVA